MDFIERLVAYLIIKIFMPIFNKKKEFIHNLFFFTIFFKAFHIDLNIDDLTKWKSMDSDQISRI